MGHRGSSLHLEDPEHQIISIGLLLKTNLKVGFVHIYIVVLY